jgi:hypothetical protein
MEETSVPESEYSNRIIAVKGFPTDVEPSSVVVASALHRTYKIRTNPSMITFFNNGEWCSVKLASTSDRRRVLTQSKQGINPIFHHRDPHQPSITLEISSDLPLVTSVSEQPESPTFSGRKTPLDTTQSIIQLSGLPGRENRLWDGVRLTASVIASMIHR